LWDQCVSEVKHNHGDNGIFSAEEYRRDCEEKGRSQSFSGVGAQHQNARAERAIQTRLPILLQLLRELIEGLVGTHSVWIYNYNRVPNAWSGLTPLELVTKERSDYKDILRCHVWGCPVYVLEAKHQHDQLLDWLVLAIRDHWSF
jgi:hypothetical protein